MDKINKQLLRKEKIKKRRNIKLYNKAYITANKLKNIKKANPDLFEDEYELDDFVIADNINPYTLEKEMVVETPKTSDDYPQFYVRRTIK